MIYSQQNYQQLPADHRSLIISFANLLAKLDSDHPSDPVALYNLLTSDDDLLDWWSIAEYVKDIDILHVEGKEGDWPNVSNAIVKFRRLDEASAGYIDHYCLITDHRTKSIIDPLDGKFKLATEYGVPSGWASYVKVEPDVELDKKEAEILAAAGSAIPNTYVVAPGENIWDVARKLSIKVERLIEFNKIEDPRTVKPGHRLHLPPANTEERPMIKYEVLDTPVPMHVSKPGGTQKFSFGHASKWQDIQPSGRLHKENSNHNIVAIAHVELKDENTTAAYYMDRIDLGNFAITGLPQFTTGFNHSHLSEGHVVPVTVVAPTEPTVVDSLVEPTAAEVAAAAMEEDDRESMVAEPTIEQMVCVPQVDDYHETLLPLNPDGSPMTFMSEENLTIHEAERLRPARPLRKGQFINISYTFEKDGVLYGLPTGTEKSGFWYCIPMDSLTSEDKLFNFNTQISLSDKIALKKELSVQERVVVILSKFMSQGTRLQTWWKKRNIKGGN